MIETHFGLQKKEKGIPWHEYGLGEVRINFPMSYNGLMSKALKEKKTFRNAQMTTTLSLAEIEEYFVGEGYYLAYLDSSEDQDVEWEEYDGPSLVSEDYEPVQKAILVSDNGDSIVYFQSSMSYDHEVLKYVSIGSTNKERVDSFKVFLTPKKAEKKKKEGKGSVYMMMADQQGISTKKAGTSGALYHPNHYSKEVQKAFEHVVDELQNPVPKGRITIFSGPPGTGKTYLIRSLIAKLSANCTFVVVPPSLVPKLGEPQMLPALLERKSEKKPMVLILEDADVLVKERMKDSIDAISAALNMGDGIIGDICNVRLIFTTNQPITEIDDAMKRPGRLSVSCVVDALNKEEIALAWEDISEGKEMPAGLEAMESATLAQVYQFKEQE